MRIFCLKKMKSNWLNGRERKNYFLQIVWFIQDVIEYFSQIVDDDYLIKIA